MAEHIALLGDSIFDNNAYTGGAPDVVTHLRGILPPGWRTPSSRRVRGGHKIARAIYSTLVAS